MTVEFEVGKAYDNIVIVERQEKTVTIVMFDESGKKTDWTCPINIISLDGTTYEGIQMGNTRVFSTSEVDMKSIEHTNEIIARSRKLRMPEMVDCFTKVVKAMQYAYDYSLIMKEIA